MSGKLLFSGLWFSSRIFSPHLTFAPCSTLISKSSSDGLERNYALTVSETSLTLDYLPQSLSSSGSQRYRSVVVDGLVLDASSWHHIAVTVFAEDAVFYVNGGVSGVRALEASIRDEATRTVLLGQLIQCESSGTFTVEIVR